ncbi:uroporphyrinogen-III synthase [Bacillus sp. SLBN-46]|uniref:uroporphyrinogen-III synthase n=1 Tax=Bacillus sp. SLBN-46 TaxID=3042283 RepID=UPI00285DFF26|nr:uroporphyrinogen-III synthase [Bacillus sp. SLBN-46]MDR6123214.1 uroporphyrinogen-III synthase [Bacillus sp. SLBN-46]
MKKALAGKRIVIGSSRKLEELQTLIEKQGGVPLVRSLQGTVFLAEKQVEPDLVEFIKNGADWVVFTTGIGLETMVKIAEKLGYKDDFLSIVRGAKVASRGYKTLAALKKMEIVPEDIDEDGTTTGLIRALQNFDFSGKKVMVQLHGETAPGLSHFLEERGAFVQKILPYQHIAPETETVQKLCQELQNNDCHAVCFTTATQVRSLFDYARVNNLHNEISEAFCHHVLAVAVGKVTLEALKEEGIERVLVPEHERMGAMIIQLAKYYQNEITN